MQTVTLIFTRHEAWGNCNSEELYEIIESIHPEVIFEELSKAAYVRIYEEKGLVTVESNAVKKYLEKNYIEHIPVDTYPLPDSYYEDVGYMYDKLFNQNRISESRTLRYVQERQLELLREYGFYFLNSTDNDFYFDKIRDLKEQILEILNDERLSSICRLEQEMIEAREEEILHNIYAYSKTHRYTQALFFIGSGHRKSIMQKIEAYKANEDLKLNWRSMGD
ncbi:hypothetical protein CMU32_12255 [Elizabethkingia anophelis]|nr:hypothetical protein [Elizabethkingia anophelis]